MRPLIVCPLQFERACVLRAGAGRWCDVTCCGPGAEGVRRWARTAVTPPDRPVILAGLAGSLAGEVRVGTARVVTTVVTPGGDLTWSPPVGSEAPTCVVTSTDTIVGGDSRRTLRERSGADLVDLESVAFATMASEAGWRWGVVRGVSDDPEHELPAGSACLVTASGRTRPFRLAGALLRRPALAGDLARLRRVGIESIGAAVGLIEELTTRR